MSDSGYSVYMYIHVCQGVVTIETAVTGVTMRSPGHGGFSKAEVFEAATGHGNGRVTMVI